MFRGVEMTNPISDAELSKLAEEYAVKKIPDATMQFTGMIERIEAGRHYTNGYKAAMKQGAIKLDKAKAALEAINKIRGTVSSSTASWEQCAGTLSNAFVKVKVIARQCLEALKK